MSSAASELESMAIRYAKEATRLDQQGSKGLAITYYQKAIDAFLKMVNLYPSYELNKVYVQRAMMYQERIKVLQVGAAAETADEDYATPDFKPLGRSDQPTKGEPQAPGKTMEAATPPKKSGYEDLLVIEKPSIGWEDVSGLDDVKRSMKEAIVYPSKRPDLFPLGWPRGILLFGPPGCGKTLSAAAVATEINASFYSVDAASIMSKWLGEAEKNVAKLFRSTREKASAKESSIVFIDEIDSLLGLHSNEVGGEIRVRNQFLKEMDGVIDKGKNWPIYVIGATNKPWALDWGFIRRFQKRIYVPVPDYKTRLTMYELYTQKLKLQDVDLREVATITEGFSGSDVRDICQAVQLKVVSELFESGLIADVNSKPRPITIADFKDILTRRKPSVTADMIKAYEMWEENFKAV